MKRILLLMTLALMLAAAMALSGVAQAKPITNGEADAKCLAEAVRTLQPGFKLSGYHFVGGTAGDDFFDRAATAGPDVFCGFGGNDSITDVDEGDIFLGGAGNDIVNVNELSSTFNGGEGDDRVGANAGFFSGGAGNDGVTGTNYGTFYGGEGEDFVTINSAFGIFNQD